MTMSFLMPSYRPLTTQSHIWTQAYDKIIELPEHALTHTPDPTGYAAPIISMSALFSDYFENDSDGEPIQRRRRIAEPRSLSETTPSSISTGLPRDIALSMAGNRATMRAMAERDIRNHTEAP